VVTVGGLNPDYRAAPLAGEHTDAILLSLGHDAASIASLHETKVVNSEPV
jgi:crotonobetainyl-CoA:carnitine CoA-transferase CaiB-like acyl-CoA transferase